MPIIKETSVLSKLPTSDADGDADSSRHHAREKADDLRQLASAIVRSGGDDQLAVDILANLAAYPGTEGHEAQQALRTLYDNPASGSRDTDDQIRASLERAAHAICELALVTAPQISGTALELPLSITVAAMACRYSAPQHDSGVTRLALAHIERQLKSSAACPLADSVISEQERAKR